MSVGIQTPNGILKVAGLGLSNSMIGATENNDGKAGLVPAPSIADRDKFLKGDGNWAEIEQVNTEEILNEAKNYTDAEIAKAVEEVGNTTSFTGTITDYEANKDTIEDGTVVYLTNDIIEGELLDAHVLNRVLDVEYKLEELKTSFQDGCDTIVAGCTTYGATPTSNSPEDIVNAIEKIYTNSNLDGNLECIYQTGAGNIQGHNNTNTIGGLRKKPKVLVLGFYYSSTIYLTATIITSLNASFCTGRDGDSQFVCSSNSPVKLVSYNDTSISYAMNWGLYPTNAAIYVYG